MNPLIHSRDNSESFPSGRLLGFLHFCTVTLVQPHLPASSALLPTSGPSRHLLLYETDLTNQDSSSLLADSFKG